MKPMLACDADESQIPFPVIAQPKIDGVRAVNFFGTLTGRSLKKFKNKFTTQLFSKSFLAGLDGEMAVADPNHPALCRLTTSALGTIVGQPSIKWHVFDYVTPETKSLPYDERFGRLQNQLDIIADDMIVPLESIACYSTDDLARVEAHWLSLGYEGVILRSMDGAYKYGRATVREGTFLRLKRFVDAEAKVVAVLEGETNTNSAMINELGLTERSTHMANMRPNGKVGTLICLAEQDITHEGTIILLKGTEFPISPGKMTENERIHYLSLPNAIIGKTVKFKFFPKGIKDALRFATFQSIRMEEDRS